RPLRRVASRVRARRAAAAPPRPSGHHRDVRAWLAEALEAEPIAGVLGTGWAAEQAARCRADDAIAVTLGERCAGVVALDEALRELAG
ncbi:MAG TPA: hypothetical protein VHF89_15290, partial [Solirubrobacteraceae bacterium]|nr:hypothetical protein [Solirubrobacteraceae bacterium]